jgi:hypothetical protein
VPVSDGRWSTQTIPREVPPALAGFLCSFFEGRLRDHLLLRCPGGAGKTYVLAHRANRLARLGQKVLFVQPTKHLITKTIEGELQPLNPNYPVRAIHGDTVDGVVAEVVARRQRPRRRIGCLQGRAERLHGEHRGHSHGGSRRARRDRLISPTSVQTNESLG